HVVLVELVNEPVKFGLEREQERDDGRPGDGEARLAEAGDEAEPDCGERGNRRRRVRPSIEARPMRIADREHGDGPGNQSAGGELLAVMSRETSETRDKSDQRKGANAGDARAHLQ